MRKKKLNAEKLLRLEYFNDEILNALESYSCAECGSDLFTTSKRNIAAVEAEYICKSCDSTLPYEDIVKLAISDYFKQEAYLSHADGGDSPITDCTECNVIYLFNEGICSSCGHVAKHKCRRCGSTILPEELYAEPFCGYCAYAMSKDD